MWKKRLLGYIFLGAVVCLGVTTPVFAANENIIVEEDLETDAIREVRLTVDESSEGDLEPSFGEEGTSPTTKSIIGTDDRVRVTGNDLYRAPYRWVAYLKTTWKNGKVTYGTAYMVGDYTAVTAAHCVYDKSLGGKPKDISIWPAMNDGVMPYSGSHTKTINVPKAYRVNKDSNYDCAVIKVKSPLGRRVGYFGIHKQSASYNGVNMYILGYPGEASRSKQLWKMKGKILSSSQYKVNYQIDTTNGQSGSPITRLYNNKWYAIGVHTSGATNPDASGAVNSGVKFNNYMFSFIKQFR